MDTTSKVTIKKIREVITEHLRSASQCNLHHPNQEKCNNRQWNCRFTAPGQVPLRSIAYQVHYALAAIDCNVSQSKKNQSTGTTYAFQHTPTGQQGEVVVHNRMTTINRLLAKLRLPHQRIITITAILR